jgi:hypothetical protein
MTRRELILEARRLGYEAVPTRGGHIRLVHPSGATVTGASTPGDCRSWLNTQADLRRELRRHGVMVEQRKLAPRQERPRKPRAVPPPAAGSFKPAGTGLLTGTIEGRRAVLELRPDRDGREVWVLRWATAA